MIPKSNFEDLTKDPKANRWTANDGTLYEGLKDHDIAKLFKNHKFDADSTALSEIYESKVPKVLFDVEAAIRNMHPGFRPD
jgi:hypothetical protein